MRSIGLIASGNFTSRAVMECLGSILTNKSSEGHPNARYNGGKARALKAFELHEKEWDV